MALIEKMRMVLLRGSALVLLLILSGCATSPALVRNDPNLGKQIMVTLVRADDEVTEIMGFNNSVDIGQQNRQPARTPRSVSRGLARKHGLRMVESWGIDALGVDVILFEVKSGMNVEKIIKQLAGEAQVESVQTVGSFRTLAYNDPYFYLQDAVSTDGIEQIHASSTGKGVTVGIIDTGVDTQHPELKDRIVFSGNFVAHDQYRFDSDQHGTAVAGVIAAKANNDLGIVGVAPDVRLMAFKACWHKNLLETRCDSFSLVKALVKALELKPDVLNLSLAGPFDPLVKRLIDRAIGEGVIVVGAVDPSLGLDNSFPASMHAVIAVASRPDKGDFLSTHSGLIAPGNDILTTAPGAGYAFESGSSMSTAHVSGIAALLKEKDPALSGGGVRDLLNHTARLWQSLPVVDMCAALMKVSHETVCTSKALVDARVVSSAPDSTVTHSSH